jgi:hypothetical protein
VTLRADANGDVVLRLTLTDGATVKTRDVPLRVGATTTPTNPPLISGGGGGGGALGPAWLAGLAMAVVALQLLRRRQARRLQPVRVMAARRR